MSKDCEVEYIDKGCSYFSSCLECPLKRCRFDEDIRRWRKRIRDLAIKRLSKNKTLLEIANLFGVSLRTVQRALSGAIK